MHAHAHTHSNNHLPPKPTRMLSFQLSVKEATFTTTTKPPPPPMMVWPVWIPRSAFIAWLCPVTLQQESRVWITGKGSKSHTVLSQQATLFPPSKHIGVDRPLRHTVQILTENPEPGYSFVFSRARMESYLIIWHAGYFFNWHQQWNSFIVFLLWSHIWDFCCLLLLSLQTSRSRGVTSFSQLSAFNWSLPFSFIFLLIFL